MIKAENLNMSQSLIVAKGDSCELAAELAVIVHTVYEEIKSQETEEYSKQLISYAIKIALL